MSIVYLREYARANVLAYRTPEGCITTPLAIDGSTFIIKDRNTLQVQQTLHDVPLVSVVQLDTVYDRWFLWFGDRTQRAIPFPTLDSAMMALQLMEKIPDDDPT